MTQEAIAKASASVVVLQTFAPAQGLQKASISVVVQSVPDSRLNVPKASLSVAVLPDVSGNAFQTTPGNRPLYRAGPKPYIEFTPGSSLEVKLLFAGTYTLILLLPDGSSTTEAIELPAGIYTLPATDFNQAVLAYGTLSRIAQASLIYSMRDRAGF